MDDPHCVRTFGDIHGDGCFSRGHGDETAFSAEEFEIRIGDGLAIKVRCARDEAEALTLGVFGEGQTFILRPCCANVIGVGVEHHACGQETAPGA